MKQSPNRLVKCIWIVVCISRYDMRYVVFFRKVTKIIQNLSANNLWIVSKVNILLSAENGIYGSLYSFSTVCTFVLCWIKDSLRTNQRKQIPMKSFHLDFWWAGCSQFDVVLPATEFTIISVTCFPEVRISVVIFGSDKSLNAINFEKAESFNIILKRILECYSSDTSFTIRFQVGWLLYQWKLFAVLVSKKMTGYEIQQKSTRVLH